MSCIAELFRRRRDGAMSGGGGLLRELEEELFRALTLTVLPAAARALAESGEGPAQRRKAKGLPDTVEDYWQNFMLKIKKDPLWPGGDQSFVVSSGYIVNSFKNLIVDAQRAEKRRAAAIPMVNLDLELERQANASDKIGDMPIDVADVDVVHYDYGAQPDNGSQAAHETQRLAERLQASAPQWLNSQLQANRPWVGSLIRFLLEPPLLDTQDPMESQDLAEIMQKAPSQITRYVQKLGVALPRSVSGRREAYATWQQSILGQWVAQTCGELDPMSDEERILLALTTLCKVNREHRNRP